MLCLSALICNYEKIKAIHNLPVRPGRDVSIALPLPPLLLFPPFYFIIDLSLNFSLYYHLSALSFSASLSSSLAFLQSHSFPVSLSLPLFFFLSPLRHIDNTWIFCHPQQWSVCQYFVSVSAFCRPHQWSVCQYFVSVSVFCTRLSIHQMPRSSRWGQGVCSACWDSDG